MHPPSPRPHKFPHNPLATRLLNGPRFPEERGEAPHTVRFRHATAAGLEISIAVRADAPEPVLAEAQLHRMADATVHAVMPEQLNKWEFARGLKDVIGRALRLVKAGGRPQTVSLNREILGDDEDQWGTASGYEQAMAVADAAKQGRAA